MRHLYPERLHWMLWPVVEGAHVAYQVLGLLSLTIIKICNSIRLSHSKVRIYKFIL